MVGLKLLPLSLVGVRDDHRVDIDGAMTSRRRNKLLLRGRDHGVQVLSLVLEDLDEFHDAAVADVKGAVEFEHPRVSFRIEIELGNVL